MTSNVNSIRYLEFMARRFPIIRRDNPQMLSYFVIIQIMEEWNKFSTIKKISADNYLDSVYFQFIKEKSLIIRKKEPKISNELLQKKIEDMWYDEGEMWQPTKI